jgi:hypothetical protein
VGRGRLGVFGQDPDVGGGEADRGVRVPPFQGCAQRADGQAGLVRAEVVDRDAELGVSPRMLLGQRAGLQLVDVAS